MILSEFHREFLARKEFAGWAPHGRILGEMNCKEPRDGDLCKGLAPRLAGCPWSAGVTGVGDKLQKGRPGGTGSVQPQETHPLPPLWALPGS